MWLSRNIDDANMVYCWQNNPDKTPDPIFIGAVSSELLRKLVLGVKLPEIGSCIEFSKDE